VLALQAYLSTIEEKTGLTPRELLEVARAKGFWSPGTKASEVKAWLKSDYKIGQGHATLVFHLIQNDSRFEGDATDRSETLDGLWLDGAASAPAGEKGPSAR
jgi:hypothetical protein